MSKIKEYYNNIQEDDPSIEYHMTYKYQGKWTPTLENWYNKRYGNNKKAKPVYIKAEKVECPF